LRLAIAHKKSGALGPTSKYFPFRLVQ